MGCGLLVAPAQSTTNRIFAARAETEFFRAQTRLQANPLAPTNAWQFARACFDRSEFASNATQQAEIAWLGIGACRELLARDPRSAAGHYYLAMNYGRLADAEAPSIAAYKLVKEIEHEFRTAADLDEHFDFAGPVRNLGELYFQAPGWPLSVGNRHKAREWLERAAVLEPDYPENQLNLAEAHLKWRQPDEAAKALRKLDALWTDARTRLAGEAREKDWQEWVGRRHDAKAELARQDQDRKAH